MIAFPPLTLASASPRRRALLEEAGIAHVVAPVEVDEDAALACARGGAAAVALALALRKALARAAVEPGWALVLGADTVVVAPEGDLLGKAADEAEARALLARLSGRTHAVVTGVALVEAASGRAAARAVESAVRFRDLTSADLDAYVASGLWRGKAGAYGVQDPGTPVASVEGSTSNVVGLPIEALAEMLSSWRT
jgi:septum formation protein